ncbi:MAG: primase C-terminal domain-containing protein [Chloroflexota bacterium]
MSSNTYATAFKLLSLGYSVIPSGGSVTGKAPLVNWSDYQDKPPDEKQLEQWQQELKPRLWGIVTNDQVAVIDADTPDTRTQLEAEIGEPHVITPRGGAHWYVDTTGHPFKTVAGLLPGIDCRGVGGFVNIAGGKYDIKRLPMPGDLIPWNSLPQRILAAFNSSKPSTVVKQGKPIPDGQRNATLTRIAGAMRRQGADQEAIEAALMNVKCQTPLPEREIKQIAASVGRYAPAPDNGQPAHDIQVFNANAQPSRKDVPHLFELAGHGKILPVKEASTFFAQGGSGKSIIAADYLPILFSNGILDSSFCALGQGNVLVLDWEADLETHRRYITAIKRGLSKRVNGDLDGGIIRYIPLYSPITATADFIREYIRANDIALVVIDSQMAAMAGAFTSMKDDQIAGIYYNILASWETTTLTIDHVPKSVMNTDYGTGAAYGSVIKYNRARSVFELKQAQEPGENVIELAFIHQKNNLGPKMKPFGLKTQFNNDQEGDLDTVIFDTFDLADSSKLEKIRPLWERARDAIMWDFNGRASTGQLASQLETNEAVIRATLNRYDKVFTKIEKTRDGVTWGLLTVQEA